MSENKYIEQILAFIGLWQAIAFLTAVFPLLMYMATSDVSSTDELINGFTFFAKWIESWLTGMIQLPSLIITIFTEILLMLKRGNPQRII